MLEKICLFTEWIHYPVQRARRCFINAQFRFMIYFHSFHADIVTACWSQVTRSKVPILSLHEPLKRNYFSKTKFLVRWLHLRIGKIVFCGFHYCERQPTIVNVNHLSSASCANDIVNTIETNSDSRSVYRKYNTTAYML